jgi:hypothetical protein
MTWTVTLFPENGWLPPRVIGDVINYEILPSGNWGELGRKKSYVIFNFASGGHITVLFDNNIHSDQISYRKFEIHTTRGNFAVGHGNSGRAHKGHMAR